MRINNEGIVIIEDRYICDFLKNNGTDDFFSTCESVIKNICLACNLKKENQTEELLSVLNIFKVDLFDTLLNKKQDLSEITKSIENLKDKINMSDVINHISMSNEITSLKIESIKDNLNTDKTVDMIISLNKINENKIENLKDKIDNIKDNLNGTNNTLVQITNKIDRQEIIKNTNKYKGEKGESGIINILESILPSRDGFFVQETTTIPHNCDINIKKTGFPDIRIECKNHKNPIRNEEIKRFESDIMGLNNHGIFISICSDICGKGQIEIDLLSNNKFAIYMSNNNYDGSIIKDYIHLLYKLDNIMSISNDDNNFKINTESMKIIKNSLIDFNNKVSSLKTNLKTCMTILNDMSVEIIEKIIHGNIPVEIKHKCDWCEKEYKSASGLTIHKKNCKSKLNSDQ